MRQKKVEYRAESADLEADGKHVRLVAEYSGPYSRGRSPRHIDRLTEAQARELRDSLNEVLSDL